MSIGKILFTNFTFVVLCYSIFVDVIFAGATPYLVDDLFFGTNSSAPVHLVEYKNQVYFQAFQSSIGSELFTSNGETIDLIKDINPNGNSFPYGFRKSGDDLYFSAHDGTVLGNNCEPNFEENYELWKTNGTREGTQLVKDLRPFRGSCPKHLTDVNGTLFFMANDGVHGYELWKSDGTSNGTRMVKDIRLGVESSLPAYLVNLNNILIFEADDGMHGYELWRSDGTEAGTYMIVDIRLGQYGSYPTSLTVFDNFVLFFAYQANFGAELWRSDGTRRGTKIIADITPGANWFEAFYQTRVGNQLFFTDNDGIHGSELWASDGTSENTRLVRDINPGPGSSSIGGIANSQNIAYFSAFDGTTFGNELWRSDGNQESTYILYDSPQGFAYPTELAAGGGSIFYQGSSVFGIEPWVSNGTTSGTQLLLNINPSSGSSEPTSFTRAGKHIFFSAYEPTHGRELWALLCCGIEW